jgi:hypothetical protein
MFLVRFTVAFRSRAVAAVADAGRAAGVFLATLRWLRTVAVFAAAGRAAVARVADADRVARLTFELVRGFTFAYDRCRDCAAETLRCAAMLLPVFAGRAA